jgi:aminobenzoyl-glutamate utilization protein B
VKAAKDYFEVQTKETKYQSFLRPDDKPAIWLNAPTMAKYREQMKKFYYNPDKYDNYLDQLGIKYPTVHAAPASGSQN